MFALEGRERTSCSGTGAASGEGACDCRHGDLRCACGSLLARCVGDEVELKCRRCKRTWRIPVHTRG